jgi:hypothetical protein
MNACMYMHSCMLHTYIASLHLVSKAARHKTIGISIQAMLKRRFSLSIYLTLYISLFSLSRALCRARFLCIYTSSVRVSLRSRAARRVSYGITLLSAASDTMVSCFNFSACASSSGGSVAVFALYSAYVPKAKSFNRSSHGFVSAEPVHRARKYSHGQKSLHRRQQKRSRAAAKGPC